MKSAKLFLQLAQLSGYLGFGMVVGANLSEGTSSTPLWIGGILIVLGAILLGMHISARQFTEPETASDTKKSQNK